MTRETQELRRAAQEPAERPLPGGDTPPRCAALVGTLIICAATLLAYSNTFDASFHFDDHHVVIDNDALRDLRSLWPPSGNRWIGYVSFALNFQVGGLRVFGYHIVNVLIHMANALLVALWTTLVIRSPALSSAEWHSTTRRYLPFVAGMLFALHPVATQAVTYVAQRFASLATLFYLASVALYLQARLQPPTAPSRARIVPYVLAVAAAVAAMKTKEIAFTLPFVLVGHELLIFAERRRLLPVAPIAASALLVVWGVAGAQGTIADVIADAGRLAAEAPEIPRWSYLLTQTRVVVRYLRLVVLPVGQNLDYDFPLSYSLAEPGVLLALVILLAVCVAAVLALLRARRMNRPEGTLVFLGIAWFFVTLSVESSLIPIRDVIVEHRVYLPAVGGAMTLATSLLFAAERLRPLRSPVLRVAAVLIFSAAPLGVATYARNRVWRDDVSLWSDVAAKSPNKPRGRHNLAESLLAAGDVSAAVRESMAAIALDPTLAEAHAVLAKAYFAQGRTEWAIREGEEATRLDPTLAIPHFDLAEAFAAVGRYEDAVRHYRETVRLRPGFPGARERLGAVYEAMHMPDEAIGAYRDALQLNPDSAVAHYFLGNALFQGKGRVDEAVREYREAIRLDPGLAEAHDNLGVLYLRRGQPAEAVSEHLAAIRAVPRMPAAHQNLANAYQAMGRTEDAVRERLEAARLAREAKSFDAGRGR